MAELRLEKPEEFKKCANVSGTSPCLSVRITTKKTWSRQTIDPGLRLAITLRYLATGDSSEHQCMVLESLTTQ